MRQYLKQEVLDKIRDEEPVIFKICTALDRKYRTVIHWITTNDIMLTTATVLSIIREHFGFSEDVELIEEKDEAKVA